MLHNLARSAANNFHIAVRHGYDDHVFTDDFGIVLYDQLKVFFSFELASGRLLRCVCG